jgi:hypothetical protein
MQKYYSEHDKIMRLHNSYVVYKGKVYMCGVREGQGTDYVFISSDDGERVREVDYTSDDFYPAIFRLGYVDTPSGAVYLTSTGIRSQRAGFTTRLRAIPNRPFRTTCSNMNQLYRNDYKSFSDAASLAKKEGTSYAFSKEFAVASNGVILTRGDIPIASLRNDEVVINPDSDLDEIEIAFYTKLLKEEVNDEQYNVR